MKNGVGILVMLVSVVLTTGLWADDEAEARPAGHSASGDAFNEGPRQAAYLMDGMAEIHFPVTTTNDQVQAFFNQGVAQLHGFWYLEAERSFRQVLALDPKCSMALWGMTMANVDNNERAASLTKEFAGRLEHLSEREKLYLKSLEDFYRDLKKDETKRRRGLVRAYEKIMQEYPDDIEAKAFLVYQIWHNSSRGKMDISSHEAVSALADQVLAVNPMHPLHHYRIHLWDNEKRERALDAAAKCGPASPGIAHMWHMPGHIYSGLKRYADAAWQQEASARVDHAHMMRDRLMPDQIHNYAHNNGWLADNLGYIGRVKDAVDLACNMIELPRLPKFKANGDWDPGRSGYASGQQRLMNVLIEFELWAKMVELDEKGYFQVLGNDDAAVRRSYGLAMAHLNLKHSAETAEEIRKLRALQAKLRRQRIDGADAAEEKAIEEKKKPEEVAAAMTAVLQEQGKKITEVKNRIREIEVVRDALKKKNRPEDLVARIESLKGVSKTRLAVLYAQADALDKAEQAAAEAVKGGEGRVLPLAIQVEVLRKAGKKDEAVKALEALRKLSAHVDLDLPVIQRLKEAVVEQGWSVENWRLPAELASDLGERPPLDSLGPFRWSPYAAPAWSMKNEAGEDVRLEDYRGRPLVLIFYLGSGCKHCIEQLDAFSKVAPRYERNGIPIVAVSRESVQDLHKTRENVSEEEWFPFTVLSDESLAQFKAYRAFDDFEGEALHGTFLIDGQGQVRWQHISFEPMMQPEFLLEEAQRLLAF